MQYYHEYKDNNQHRIVRSDGSVGDWTNYEHPAIYVDIDVGKAFVVFTKYYEHGQEMMTPNGPQVNKIYELAAVQP